MVSRILAPIRTPNCWVSDWQARRPRSAQPGLPAKDSIKGAKDLASRKALVSVVKVRPASRLTYGVGGVLWGALKVP